MAEERKSGESTGLAAAMAVGEGGARADTFLDEQTRLTRLQIAQIEEENRRAGACCASNMRVRCSSSRSRSRLPQLRL